MNSQWATPAEPRLITFARNVSTRYVLVLVNVAIGLVMLPYNVLHLGTAEYGLWTLAASIATYFSVLDLGFGGAVVKYVAEFRARRDVNALNEILSTMSFVFTRIALVAYGVAALVALAMPHLFHLDPGQVTTGRIVLMLTSLQVALFFHFSIYGAVINAFERYYVNNVVGLIFNLATAIVNVVVLALGYGLTELVMATTAMRLAPLWIYRRNAYTAFPELRIHRSLVRRQRLRDLSGFSACVAVVDWSTRLTYATDAFYLAAFMNTAAVGVYAVAQRVSETLFNLTYQLHTFLLPAVVHGAVDGDAGRQRALMVRATRFQLAIAVCLCGGVGAVADVVLRRWIGPSAEGAITATRLLCVVVVMRAWAAMPGTVLQGIGHPRFVAVAAACCALVNLILSVPLVIRWGLVGVAAGTLVAASLYAVIVFPRACMAVGMSVWRGYRAIVWPAVWPGVLVAAVLFTTRTMVPEGMVPMLAHLCAGGVSYAAIFVMFGLDSGERQWLVAAALRILRRDTRRLATSDVLSS